MSPRPFRHQPEEEKARPLKGILKQRPPSKETKRQRQLRRAREKREDREAKAEGDRIRSKVRSHSIGWFMYACTSVLHAHTIAGIFEPQAGRDVAEENDTDSGYGSDDSEEEGGGTGTGTGTKPVAWSSCSEQSEDEEMDQEEPVKKRRRLSVPERNSRSQRRRGTPQ